jgi:hypothetical protein
MDKSRSKPVTDCIVIIKGTTTTAITSRTGEFTFPDEIISQKTSLVFNLFGYITKEYDLSNYQKDTFYLVPKNIALQEVEIHAKQKNILNEKMPEPILDFDLLNGDILLLTAGTDHNYLKLIDEYGKSVSILKAESHTESLKRDCLNNVQLFNKDSAWQIFYDYEKLNLMNACPQQTYSAVLGNCVCTCNNNYYFKNMSYRNLRTNYFYYNEFDKGRKHELAKFEDTEKIRGFELDYNLKYFLDVRRQSHYTMYNEPVDSIKCKMEKYREELPLDWAYIKWLGNVATEMVKTDSGLFIVNFTDTVIYRVNENNEVVYNSKLNCLHYKDVLYKVYRDAERNDTYLIQFTGNKLALIKFNIADGKEISRTEIPNVPYLPKKIVINNGKVYYIQKDLASDQVYKLIKFYLN